MTCLRCGTRYEAGWTCPTCAHRESVEASNRHLETLAAAAAESAAAQARAAGESARAAEESIRLQQEALELQEQEFEQRIHEQYEMERRQRKIVSESWRLRAQSQYERAEDLLGADMASEALVLARKAIQEDPTHLGARLVISSALHRLSSAGDAVAELRKAIALLRTSQYSRDAQSHADVVFAIAEVGKPEEAVEEVLRILAANANGLGKDEDGLRILGEALLSEGVLSGVEVLWDSTTNRNLLIASLYLESLTRRGRKDDTGAFKALLARYDPSKSEALRRDLGRVFQLAFLGEETRHTIRGLASAVVDGWQSHFEDLWHAQVSPPDPSWAGPIWAGIGACFIGEPIFAALVRAVVPVWPRDLVGAVTLLQAAIVVTGAVFLGASIRRGQRKRVEASRTEKLEKLRHAEKEKWQQMGLTVWTKAFRREAPVETYW